MRKIILSTLLTCSVITSGFIYDKTAIVNSKSANCVLVRGEPSYEYENPISVGRKIEHPISWVYLSSSGERELTCEIVDSSATTWTGKLAIPDNSNMEMVQLSIYLDGNLEQKISIFRGNVTELNIDVGNHKNVSFNYKVKQGNGNHLYFLKWDLN
ncbi:hypothetical protein A0J48_010285 [Sphaerospermopsis aphanizomenoides BCCUSP55]|uniref:hypothetical protein n=1 Tax=Sphaerospermopsis aphanizomenoides TaxID=459663 RepID=UPI0019055C50|nr:hypothetical protein [Sphaerospermopsis aphanizomenoides]MBK1987923.1 hypothetical protein [Sphaerospermopsis aphanizomenoides BCCUSP55]